MKGKEYKFVNPIVNTKTIRPEAFTEKDQKKKLRKKRRTFLELLGLLPHEVFSQIQEWFLLLSNYEKKVDKSGKKRWIKKKEVFILKEIIEKEIAEKEVILARERCNSAGFLFGSLSDYNLVNYFFSRRLDPNLPEFTWRSNHLKEHWQIFFKYFSEICQFSVFDSKIYYFYDLVFIVYLQNVKFMLTVIWKLRESKKNYFLPYLILYSRSEFTLLAERDLFTFNFIRTSVRNLLKSIFDLSLVSKSLIEEITLSFIIFFQKGLGKSEYFSDKSENEKMWFKDWKIENFNDLKYHIEINQLEENYNFLFQKNSNFSLLFQDFPHIFRKAGKTFKYEFLLNFSQSPLYWNPVVFPLFKNLITFFLNNYPSHLETLFLQVNNENFLSSLFRNFLCIIHSINSNRNNGDVVNKIDFLLTIFNRFNFFLLSFIKIFPGWEIYLCDESLNLLGEVITDLRRILVNCGRFDESFQKRIEGCFKMIEAAESILLVREVIDLW